MAEWTIYVYLLFPLPLLLLILLSLPVPYFIRNITLKITNIVFINIPGSKINIYNLCLGLSTLLLFLSTSSVWNHSRKVVIKESDHRCYRWRLERNFWISVLAFTVWLVLGRFRSALLESERYRQEIKRLETKAD